MLQAFVIYHSMKFAVFEHYLTDDTDFPRDELIQLIEEDESTEKTEIPLNEKYAVLKIPLPKNMSLSLAYDKGTAPDEEEVTRLIKVAEGITNGDKLAINHVVSSFQAPF